VRRGEVGGSEERRERFGEGIIELGVNAEGSLVDENGLVPRLLEERVVVPGSRPAYPAGRNQSARSERVSAKQSAKSESRLKRKLHSTVEHLAEDECLHKFVTLVVVA